jgi:hypothetical protein
MKLEQLSIEKIDGKRKRISDTVRMRSTIKINIDWDNVWQGKL